MRRLTVVYSNGAEMNWECESSSWGDQSHNAILRDVVKRDGEPFRKSFVLVPLQGTLYMTEESW